MMRVAEVRDRVNAVAVEVHDPEKAHGLEEDLWRDVLKAIEEGHPFPRTLARLALETQDIEFPRWGA